MSNDREPLRTFRCHLTVLVEAESMEEADQMVFRWLDHPELMLSTGITTEVAAEEEVA